MLDLVGTKMRMIVAEMEKKIFILLSIKLLFNL